MSSETYHEPYDLLSDEVKDLHRGILSLMEELEAIDWYQQRADVCTDEQLRAVLLHNRDEEIEHAVMVLEWLRRRIPKLDAELRTYLFTDRDILAVEEEAESGEAGGETRPASPGPPRFRPTIGSLRGRR